MAVEWRAVAFDERMAENLENDAVNWSSVTVDVGLDPGEVTGDDDILSDVADDVGNDESDNPGSS